MKRLAGTTWCVGAMLLAVLWAVPSCADEVCPSVVSVKGKTQVTRAGRSLEARVGLQLKTGDVVRVQAGALTLLWPGGTKALLDQGALVTIQGRTTALGSGSMWMNVIPDPRGQTQYRVRTPRTMGAVEGTQVLFRYDPATLEWVVQLWRGKVLCTSASGEVCGPVEAGVQHRHVLVLSGSPSQDPVAGLPSAGSTPSAPPPSGDSKPGASGVSRPPTISASSSPPRRVRPYAAHRKTSVTSTRFDVKANPWKDF